MLLKIHPSAFLILVCGDILTVFADENNKRPELHRIRKQITFAQDEENAGCQLPPLQPNGLFSPSRRRCPPDNDIAECQMTPGNPVPHNWVLFHSCDTGYVLNNTATTASVCLNGRWRPVLPRCIKLCPALLPSPSVKSKCVFRGKNVSCDSEMRPETVASAECQQFYRTSFEKRCSDSGSWSVQNRSFLLTTDGDADEDKNPTFHCSPECGLSRKTEETGESSSPTIINRSTNPGQFPWVAGIYHKNDDGKWGLVCAGTLINNHIVMTAAHCVVTNGNVKMDPGDVRVGLGKYHRDFYKTEIASGIVEVKYVEVHSLFEGSSAFYANDIALLSLLLEVQMSAFIMPVCIDLRQSSTPASGTLVELTGWSKIQNGTRGETITSTQMKFTRNEDCYRSLEPRFKKYLTADKACVQKNYEDDYGTSVGIGGAGITFEKEGRHILVGFISTRIPDQNYSMLFSTDIYFGRHSNWLKNTISTL